MKTPVYDGQGGGNLRIYFRGLNAVGKSCLRRLMLPAVLRELFLTGIVLKLVVLAHYISFFVEVFKNCLEFSGHLCTIHRLPVITLYFAQFRLHAMNISAQKTRFMKYQHISNKSEIFRTIRRYCLKKLQIL